RAMAYEIVRQHLLAQKLETEKLGRQNEALYLQQKLDAKAAEANRLYLVLLLMLLGIGVVWMARLKRSQLRFERLSRTDGLTAVLNRQGFMAEVRGILQRPEHKAGTACLLYLDLDHFKHINDAHGHAVGDETLRRVAEACRQQLRPDDLLGRLGGEEFGILLQECAREQGRQVANRIRRAIELVAVEFDGLAVAVTASVGLACTDSSGHDLSALCAAADAALYRAKERGRNCVVADDGGDAAMA
ncbi:MAG: GGDEF domain-containing protein, partial [Xanthomonadaceae bacterium]|nr:GGDEF domain-containing protein [Xanthomonadaceae bacterium]